MLKIKNTVLLVIDVQGKLASMMHDHHYLRHVQAAIKTAQLLDIPVVMTEQAPEKIGITIDAVRAMLPDGKPIIKQTFSCCGESEFVIALKRLKRKQVIVVGIESHVCVYQTVRDLIKMKHEVYLAVDAVSARKVIDKDIGIRRCEREGAILVTVEMLITELIESTKHPQFREIMKLLKENNA